MFKFLLIIISFCLILQKTAALDGSFLGNFFLNIKLLKCLILFSCSNFNYEIFTTIKHINKLNILWQNVDMNKVNLSKLPDILSYNYPYRCGIVVDCRCSNYTRLLKEASNRFYFNQTFNWLIIDDENFGIMRMLEPVKNIQINSDITFAGRMNTVYNLIDVFAYGRHLKDQLYIRNYGNWSLATGMMINYKFPPKNYQNYRGDFHGLTLRGVTVIDLDNVLQHDIHRLLTATEQTDGVAPFVKYYYNMVVLLQDTFNFNVYYRVTRGWAGRLSSGFRLGALGVLQRGEVDVGATGSFFRISRLHDFDIIHEGWVFKAAFLFRATPDLDAGDAANFLSPFNINVWIIYGIFMFLIIMILKISDLFYWKTMKKNVYAEKYQPMTTITAALNTIAATCQQGIEPISYYNPTRIVILVLLVTSLLLYNFYTSSVVGSLLSASPKGPQTIKQLVDSSLVLSFEDIGYHKILFRETKDPNVRHLYDKKVKPYRSGNDTIPVYLHIADAIPYLKHGGYAFHCETSSAYTEIAKQFDANEICDLRELAGLMETNVLMMPQPKRNQYSEMFKIALLRAKEVGIVHKISKMYHPGKPVCQSAATIHPVSIKGISSIYIMLSIGFLLAISFLIIEILFNKISKLKFIKK